MKHGLCLKFIPYAYTFLKKPKSSLMKTYRYLWAVLITATLFVQCKNETDTDVEAETQTEMEVLKENTEIDLSGTEAYYVLAASGLRMRTGPSLKSEKMDVVEYSEKIQVIMDDAIQPIVVNGIKGRMLKVIYKNKTGYMFEGYLSSIPVPEKEQTYAAYARQLKRKGYDANFEERWSKEEPIGYETLTLPTKNLQEAFLIVQRLNIFPISFDLPANANPKSLTTRINGKTVNLKVNKPNFLSKVLKQPNSPNSKTFIFDFSLSYDDEGNVLWYDQGTIGFEFNTQKILEVIKVDYIAAGADIAYSLKQSESFYILEITTWLD
jgi:hypothetical protein